MKRRSFMTQMAGAFALSTISSRLLAETNPMTMPMGHDMGAKPLQPAVPLANINALKGGQVLQALVPLKNESTRNGLFKGTLIAAPVDVGLISAGKTTFWAYNNAVPGPMIEVMAGDRVEILFKNHLSQASTIHWHGLPVPPDQDGNPDDLVLPGETRLYQFTLPKDCAGTYWYHPHPHGDTPEQVYRGLAGVFIVRDPEDPLAGIPERHLVISDLKLQQDGQIAPNDANDEMNGREGQFVLINGQYQPQIPISAPQERWRIWNATNARYLNLSWGDARFTQVGTDGGLLSRPVPDQKGLLLVPGQRAELLVNAGVRSVTLAAEIYQRGKMGVVAPEVRRVLADIKSASVAGVVPALPLALRQLALPGPVKAKKLVVFSEKMSMQNGQHSMQFLINGGQFDMNRVDLVSRLGEVEEWEIQNKADMDHPFHIHGAQFMVTERLRNGQIHPEPYLAWRDVVNVTAGETVRFRIVQHFRGRRMFHCHILEHESAGMMGNLLVV
ncbi:multicopper oxidase family protein [Leeia oryzae]|uniref:multicopper oxidase family protein n=1 Tax=Leeia oryzae TaxID=356662 RepID=UPI000379D09A|nr:multicopper oxidase family protein [Leeia oryzae]